MINQQQLVICCDSIYCNVIVTLQAFSYKFQDMPEHALVPV